MPPRKQSPLEGNVTVAEESKSAPSAVIGQDHNIKLIELAAHLNEAVRLIGETGTGKTSLVKHVAHKLGKKWFRFNLTGETSVDDFVGKYTIVNGATVWQDGVLLQAMRNGYWLICDEINAALPEILFVLQSLLDDDRHVMVAQHDGEIVHPHHDFRFFATMNPVDEYAGTKELNKAFRSRIGVTVFVQGITGDMEANLLKNRAGIQIDQSRLLVMVANRLRQLKEKEQVFITVSTRDLIQWALLSKHVTVAEAFAVTVVNKSDNKDERVLILETAKGMGIQYQEIKNTGNHDLDPNWYAAEMKKLTMERNKPSTWNEKAVRDEIRAEEHKKLVEQLNGW